MWSYGFGGRMLEVTRRKVTTTAFTTADGTGMGKRQRLASPAKGFSPFPMSVWASEWSLLASGSASTEAIVESMSRSTSSREERWPRRSLATHRAPTSPKNLARAMNTDVHKSMKHTSSDLEVDAHEEISHSGEQEVLGEPGNHQDNTGACHDGPATRQQELESILTRGIGFRLVPLELTSSLEEEAQLGGSASKRQKPVAEMSVSVEAAGRMRATYMTRVPRMTPIKDGTPLTGRRNSRATHIARKSGRKKVGRYSKKSPAGIVVA